MRRRVENIFILPELNGGTDSISPNFYLIVDEKRLHRAIEGPKDAPGVKKQNSRIALRENAVLTLCLIAHPFRGFLEEVSIQE